MTERIPHTESGRFPCACDIAEVFAYEQEFLNRFDNWYGDKGYRQHADMLEMLAPVTQRLEFQRSTIKALQERVLELGKDEHL